MRMVTLLRFPIAMMLACAALALDRGVAHAQHEEVAVLHAAAEYSLERIPVRPIAIDPRILVDHGHDGARWNGLHDTTTVERLGAVVGGTSITIDEAWVCRDPATKCQLEGVEAVIALGKPRIEGDTATVRITFWVNYPDRRGHVKGRKIVELEDRILTLAYADGDWLVVGTKLLRIS